MRSDTQGEEAALSPQRRAASVSRAAFEAACAIVRRLQAHGHAAYFAGGLVRDHLLGRAPKDIDIATSARPEQLRALLPEAKPSGERFGVLSLPLGAAAHETIEVATFRTEGPYLDGRRPAWVRPGTLAEDARRRDLTVNALYLDPVRGRVIDLVGGRADLEARRLRTVGDPRRRFAEDRLRLFRTVRLGAELAFDIEPAALAAMQAVAARSAGLSPPRVFEELSRLLCAPARRRGLEWLRESGLLAVWLPEAAALHGVEQPPAFHPEGDCWTHTLLVLEALGEAPVRPLAWAALLHDVGKPPTLRRAERIRFDGHAKVGAKMAHAILERLQAPARLRELVVELVRDHLKFIDVPRMREATLKRFLRRRSAPLHLALHRADCLGSHGKLDTWRFCLERLEAWRREGEQAALRPARLLGGRDLIAAGYRPGPIFRTMLQALEDAQLEGAVCDRAQALAWLRRRFPLHRAETGAERDAASAPPRPDRVAPSQARGG